MRKFIAGMLSDDQGRPSSQRVCLLLITICVLVFLGAAQFKTATFVLPAVPDSFANMIQWMVSALGLGILAPKAVTGVQATVQAIKGVPNAGEPQN